MPVHQPIVIDKPISTTDLRKLIETALPAPPKGQRRYAVVNAFRDDRKSWVVISLAIRHAKRVEELSELYHEGDLMLVLTPSSGSPFSSYSYDTSPLTNWRESPKIYKTLEYLRRDIEDIAGKKSVVILATMSLEDDDEPTT